jgi:hypothetical protein
VLGRIGHVLGVCAAGEELDARELSRRLDDDVLARAEVRDH